MITDKQREAYLVASLCPEDLDLGPMVSRAYVREKVQFAFSRLTTDEAHLLGRLDPQRRAIYSRYLKEALNGR